MAKDTEKRKSLVLLGSTGSIGVQAIDVAAGAGYDVVGLAAGSRVAPFEEQVRRLKPAVAAMYDEAAAKELRGRVRDLPVRVLAGMDGLCELAALPQADMVLNAVVGMVGLRPTLAAVEAGHDVALANKETLVAGGALVTAEVQKRGVHLLPVDSEHSAIFQCLQGEPPHNNTQERALARLILTASGGPFFGKTAAELEKVTVEDALRHPNWSMGAKITVDSASMMNKGLELIEAHWLFDMPPERIDIVVHRESVVHSLVEYADHSVVAQLGVPDMRIPIQYALTWPHRLPSPVPRLDLTAYGKLTFCAPDDAVFPGMNLCREALKRGGLYPAAVNAANEEAVALFLQGKIAFPRIAGLVSEALTLALPEGDGIPSVSDILEADAFVRERTRAAV